MRRAGARAASTLLERVLGPLADRLPQPWDLLASGPVAYPAERSGDASQTAPPATGQASPDGDRQNCMDGCERDDADSSPTNATIAAVSPSTAARPKSNAGEESAGAQSDRKGGDGADDRESTSDRADD